MESKAEEIKEEGEAEESKAEEGKAESKFPKKRILLGALGAAGIIATVFLALFLTGALKQPEAIAAVPEPELVVVEEAPLAAALTEEEINALYDSAKNDSSEEAKEEYVSPIDFASLQELNEDVYAWITVEGTVIDYPILQHPTDNSRYLDYNIDGSYGYPGCIYTENMNSKDFRDRNTVIYGHNLKNGAMLPNLNLSPSPLPPNPPLLSPMLPMALRCPAAA
jgi:hypothetical protein